MSEIAGRRYSTAHSEPNNAVSSFRLCAAADRMLEISSPSQPTQSDESFSLKKSLPSCWASIGTCSIMASRILHFPSCARSRMAGNSDCDSKSTPITSFSADSDEIKFKRTSDAASLSRRRTGGTKCEIVASLPKIGASCVATIASAARTCSLSSSVRLVIRFTNLSATEMRAPSADSSPEAADDACTMASHDATSARLNVAAVRTSASGSCSSFSYAGTSESIASGRAENAAITPANFDAAVQRTLQDRSSIVATISGTNIFTKLTSDSVSGFSLASAVKTSPNSAQFSVVCNRTESGCSFEASFS
mmetsp:Transcript_15037/g.21283  ORF Transcript_15037/g.21283 Transcript_15037/m.21283 type:complete len:307 (-) Transcript_15037:915-1835(-)